eukprot:4103907-Heterocapsa_arctica.AAC.1
MPETAATLAGAGEVLTEKQAKYGIRDVLVQKGFFAIAGLMHGLNRISSDHMVGSNFKLNA